MPRLMITGSTGFVGGYLRKAVGECYQVIRRASSETDRLSIVVPELDRTVNWTRLIPGDVECIVHLAGIAHNASLDEDYIRRINVDGTLHLAKQAVLAGVKRFVFVSSIGVNGALTKNLPFSVNSIPSPHNFYSKSKHDVELGLKKISEETGLEVVIVRPTLVYGPNAPGNFGMLTKLVKIFPVLPFGLVNNRRDFIAVQNLADLLVTCTSHPNAAGHTFLATDGVMVSIKEFTNAIAKGLDKKIFQLPIPVGLMNLVGKATGKSAMLEQLFCNLEVDSSNNQQVLGWTPPFTMEQSMALLKDSDK